MKKSNAVGRIILWGTLFFVLLGIFCVWFTSYFGVNVFSELKKEIYDEFDLDQKVGSMAGGEGAADGKVVGDHSIRLSDEIRDLKLDWGKGKVTVKATDTDEIIISEKGDFYEEDAMVYLVKGDTLIVSFCKNEKKDRSLEKEIGIFLPRKMAQGLSGLEIDLKSGDLELEGIDAKEVSLEVADGDHLLSKMEIGDLEIDTVSGNVWIKGSAVSCDISSVSGNVYWECTAKPSALEWETVSGNLEVSLEELDGFVAEVELGTGEFRCDWETEKKGLIYRYGNGGGNWSFESKTGSVTVKKAN